MNNQKLATINQLNEVAHEMRERQELIKSALTEVNHGMASAITLARDQGAALVQVENSIKGHCSIDDWLKAHVPALSPDEAKKYKRITSEHLVDPRQCAFAFLPKPETTGDKVKRIEASDWEKAAGAVAKLNDAIADVDSWPAGQRDALTESLAGIMAKLSKN